MKVSAPSIVTLPLAQTDQAKAAEKPAETPEAKKPARALTPAKTPNAPAKLSASDDALVAAGRHEEYLTRVEGHVAQIKTTNFKQLDAALTESWIGELYFLQQRLVGIANKVIGKPALEARAHAALQTVCDLQTIAFNRACEILDEGQTNPLGAWVVYTIALRLFGVDASFVTLFPYLPVIFFAATVPTPMRAAAITLWVVLFPNNVGQMAAFGFVQHNFFVLFNALLGLVFLRRARRELFGS